MVTLQQRQQLEAFLYRSLPGAPYTRRVKIILLSADGLPAGAIAAQVKMPISQILTFQRAFERQGTALLPETIFREPALFRADDDVAVAGRAFFAAQLSQMVAQESAILEQAEATAIHETRKAIRRLRTIMRVLQPYLSHEALKSYRRQLQSTMGQVGYARDVAVFLAKLSQWLEEWQFPAGVEPHLTAMQQYWQEQLTQANQQAQTAISSPEHQITCQQLQAFCQEQAELPAGNFAPRQVRHLAAALIYPKLADVRAFDPYLSAARLTDMHQLRIRFKELRYTLEFFAPLMSEKIEALLESLNQIQDHLGNLNDARIALEFLDQTPNHVEGVTLYRAAKEGEIKHLLTLFPDLWQQFNALSWRQNLAAALVVL